jgi:hypothetical protein
MTTRDEGHIMPEIVGERRLGRQPHEAAPVAILVSEKTIVVSEETIMARDRSIMARDEHGEPSS